MAIERLSGADLMMRRVDEVWPQDNGALLFLDGAKLFDSTGRFRIERIAEVVAARLPRLPRFRKVIRVVRRGLGDPLWVDAPAFELSRHLHVRRLPEPADEACLLRIVEELRRERLNPQEPLWQIWFLTGLADQRVAVFAKVNHTIADGMAVIGAIGTMLDAAPEVAAPVVEAWRPAPAPTAGELFADALRRALSRVLGAARALFSLKTVSRALAMLPAVRELFAEEPASPSSLDRVAGNRRRIALLRSTLEAFRQVAHAHGASVNDVFLAVLSGGLRALLTSRGELAPGFTVRAYVPVSLRGGRRDAVQGNEVAEMVVALPVSLSDPSMLLRALSGETRRRKARARSTMVGLLRSRLVTRLLMKALNRQRVNVTTANLPGPPLPLYLCGAKVLEVFPVLPLIGKAALGVAAVSYAGELNVSVVADEDAYPDLDVFLAGASAQLEGLVPALSVPRPADAPRGVPPRPSAGRLESRPEGAP